jgi:spermidine synthase
MLTLQTVLIRLGGLSLGSSQFTFSLVVAVFVLCIALGSLLVSQLPRISNRLLLANQWLLAAYLGLLYLVMENAPYATHVLRSLVRSDPHWMWLFFPVIFLALLALIGPPVMILGAVLPLLFHHLRREAADLGAIAGRLYSWNTVGSVAGALLGGYLLFFWLDLEGVFRVAPTAWSTYKLSVGAFRFRTAEPATYQGADAFYTERQRRTGEKILFYKDDPVASIAVREFRYGDNISRAIISNGKFDGALIDDYPTMALLALVPALVAENAERVLAIGWGTGVTVSELAALDSVKQVDVAEISSGVIDAAFWFEQGNLGASQNPRVKITRTDAYRALHQSRGGYDIIASEPSNPWVAGVEMLFSREFLEAARNRFAPGGVFVQWFPTYETDDETVALVLRTFTSVFHDSAVWYTTAPDLLLIGFKNPG